MFNSLRNYFTNRKRIKEHNIYMNKVFQKASDGDKASLYELGMLYENGVGVEKNLEKASGFYLEAAQKGMIAACRKLGCWCDEGINGQRDVEQALYWFRICAQSNNLDDEFRFSLLCAEYEGDLTEKDIKFASHVLEDLAQDKEPAAMFGLARMIEKNLIDGDSERVFSLMKLAAFKGNVGAQIWMGDQAAAYDITEAKRWYNISVKNGNKEAVLKLQQLKETS